MRIGISSYTFPWAIGTAGQTPLNSLTIAQLLHYAHANGIKNVQLCDNLPVPLHRRSRADLREIKALADQYQIQIETGTCGLTGTHLLVYLEIAQYFNSPFLRVVMDEADHRPSVSEAIEIINEVIENFRGANVVLAIENHDRFSAADLVNIVQSTDNEYVGICLDTANSLGAAEGFKEVVTALAPYTVNLHVKDFTIKRLPHKMGFLVEGCAAGDGLLKVGYVLEKLASHNRCLSATLEVWSSPAETTEQSIENERVWVEKSLRFLRDLPTFAILK